MNFNGVLGNKTLRQAILMAIDNDTICNSKTIGGLYTPGFSVLPSTLNYGYDELVNPYTYDPEKAKQILDEAGIVDTDGDGIRELDGQNINLRYISYENRLLNDFQMLMHSTWQKLVSVWFRNTAALMISGVNWQLWIMTLIIITGLQLVQEILWPIWQTGQRIPHTAHIQIRNMMNYIRNYKAKWIRKREKISSSRCSRF